MIATRRENLFQTDAEIALAESQALHVAAMRTRKEAFELPAKALSAVAFPVSVAGKKTAALLIALANHTARVVLPPQQQQQQQVGGDDNDQDVEDADNSRKNEITTIASLRAGHQGPVTAVAAATTGDSSKGLALTASWDKTAALWDVTSQSVVRRFEGHTDFVQSIVASEFDSQGVATRAFTGARDAKARLWDVESGKSIRIFDGHRRVIDSLALGMPNSDFANTLITCSSDTTVKLWDTRSGNCERTLEGHHTSVTDIAVHHEGSLIFTASADKTVRKWDLASGKTEHVYEHPDYVKRVALVGPSLFTGTTDGLVRQFDVSSDKLVSQEKVHSEEVTGLVGGRGLLYTVSADRMLTALPLAKFGTLNLGGTIEKPLVNEVMKAVTGDTEGLSLSDQELLDELMD